MLKMLSSQSFQSHSSPRHPVPSPAPSGGGVTRGARGAQEEPLRRLSAVVTNNTDPFVIEQLHKLELSAGSCVRLNNGGMKSKEAGPGTDSVQLQVEKLSLASSNFYPDWELIHDI